MRVNYNLQIMTLFISPICFIALVFSTSGLVEPYENLYNYMPARSCKNPIKTIIICQGHANYPYN